jgi:hypothetical protein
MVRAGDEVQPPVMDRATTRRAAYAVLALVCATGLTLSLISSVTADEPPPLGTRIVRFLSLFTVESNILVLAVALLVAFGTARGAGFALAHLDALIGITVTGIVFATILAPDQEHVGLSSVLLHYVSPPLALVLWLVLGPWDARSWRVIGAALLWPLAFLLWTVVHGAISDWYPYGFIDAGELGAGRMLRNALLVLVLGVALGLAVIAVDRRRARG